MAANHDCEGRLTRRDVIRMGVAGGGAVLLADRLASAGDAPAAKPEVWVFHCEDNKKLMKRCMEEITKQGGFGKDVKRLTLKINAAWWRTPEQGANTHPELADTFIKACKDQGIKEIVMPEHPVVSAKKTFPRSGLLAVAKANNVPMIDLGAETKHFKEVDIPKGKRLKKAMVAEQFIETDALVNMPVAKHHGGARLTMAMKNWMGSVQDRRFWHRNNLHQCIADFSTFIKPTWTIIDATRIMPDRGPQGPSKNLKHPHLLILSRDQVAADVYASTLFPKVGPKNVRYLQMAREMKLGPADPSQITVHKIEVS